MNLVAGIPLFILWTLLAGFYAAAVAGLTAFARLLEERERAPRMPPGLSTVVLRDASQAVTAWAIGAVWAVVAAARALGAAVAGDPAAPPSAVELWLVPSGAAAALLAGFLGWKRVAEAFPRVYCEVAAVLVLPFFLVLYPVRRPLSAALARLFPPLTLRAGVLTTEDVKEIADGDEHPRLLHRDEREMISRVIELTETRVREIMVPRIDMVALEESTPISEVIAVIQREGHSRMPVYRESVDDIVGFLYSKDLITHHDRLESLQLRELVRPTTFVPETKRVGELLAEMRARRNYLVLVVDEYGGTAGLVTMEDVIEEVVGEIHDELDEEQSLVNPQPDGSFKLDAKVDLDDLNERLGVGLPADEYDTLGGFMFALAGKIPAAGDRFEYEGLEFTISGVRGRRITQVLLRPREPLAAPDPGREAPP
jgi:CBS domain containing-hemolysin-like protein